MATFKPVVVSATDRTGGGAVGIAIVSFSVSGPNSYVAPGTFAWLKIDPNRFAEMLVGPSVSW